ncbi:MAG: phosphatidate cytidylyltransferase [Clostridia bacterium]|nr:phosphatidate cytidylyltransferase [Clostridia bacterium]
MITRILTAIVALLVFVPALMFGGVWGASLIFALICGFSIYEMLSCCGLLKNYSISIPAIIGSAICVGVCPLFETRLFAAAACLLAVVILSLMYFLLVCLFQHKTVNTERVLMFYGLAVYITAGFVALSELSALRPVLGLWSVALVLAISWCTDTFAYFSGMLFGKKKLCPDISPKKTVAGAIGGTIFGTLAGVVVFWIAQNDPIWGLMALPVSIISQLGDLVASVIKRRFDVKDYGKIFPGHGGVLDRFDSVIPASITTAIILISSIIIYNYFM